MEVSLTGANAAYRAAGIGDLAGTSQAAEGAAPLSGQGFGNLLKDAVHFLRAGEASAAQGATGKGDIVQVVNAVTQAELTLETVVAIRDRVISAYQDIMRMPI